MDPTAADGEAFLTTCNRQRQRRDRYLIEVATNGLRHPVYPPVGPKRSVLMRAGSWPSSTSAFAVASTNPVDTPAVPLPTLGLLTGKSEADVDLVGGGHAHQLVTVDDLLERAGRVEQAHRDDALDGVVVTQHRTQRHDARAARDEQERAPERLLPDEVAADRPSQLELVTGTQLIGEIRGHLAVFESLHRQHEITVFGRGGDRVAALRLVPVLGGQANVDVLSGAVTGPSGCLEDDAANARSLFDQLDHVGQLPCQSPQ